MTPRSTGLICAITAVTIFSVQDGISKHLGTTYPPVFITMIRYWGFAAFALALGARSPAGLKATTQASRPWLQTVRGVLLAVQIIISIYSFSRVGLAASHTIFAATPLFVACLSVVFLDEAVGWRRWTAICVGFIGILFVINPVHATFDWKIIIPIVATLMFSCYSVMTRLASRTDTSMTAFFYTGVAGAITLTFVGPFYWTNLAPVDWIWMLVLCVTGMTGHYLLIRAFDLLDASAVQPMSYIQTVLVCLIGVFIFGEVMTANMIATIWREARLGRTPPPAIDPPATP
jgi:drug/metabolite transporter (DMT)-like permease